MTGPAGPSELLGTTVTHRRYVSYSDAHYAGNLVDGAYLLACFGDVATEMCIRTDGDEGLFASYSDVQFRAPVHGGDVLEVTARLLAVGQRSRRLAFAAHVCCRSRPDLGPSSSEVLTVPVLVASATGTVVVPAAVVPAAVVPAAQSPEARPRADRRAGADRSDAPISAG